MRGGILRRQSLVGAARIDRDREVSVSPSLATSKFSEYTHRPLRPEARW